MDSGLGMRAAAALLAGLVCLCGVARAGESALERSRRLAASDRRAERVEALGLLRALARPGTGEGDEAAWRCGELCLRFHGEGERGALAEARKAFEALDKGAGSRWGLRGRLGLLRVAAAEGRREEAERGLARFLVQNTRCERAAEAAYYLGCLYPDAGDDLDGLKKARTALERALALHREVSAYHPPVVAEKTVADRLERVRRRLRELEAGRLKVLFEKAEALRRGAKFKEAIAVYRQIRSEFPGHDLTELSWLRIAQCLLGGKQLREALAEVRSFVAEDPLGAYRGQAHLLAGDIWLEHYFSVPQAEPEFRCVLDPAGARPAWVKEAHAGVLARRRSGGETPMPAAAPAAEPGESWKEAQSHAHERIGIVEYLRRSREKAAGHFEASQKLSPNRTYGSDPHQGMAELADKIRRKVEIVPESLLAERAERPTLVLLLASLYMEGWRDDRAMGLLRRVADGEFEEASLNQKAYARVKIAEGLFYQKKDDEAVRILRDFESKPWQASAYAARALLQLAVVTNRQGDFDGAVRYLEKCHARDPGSEWGEYALYQKAYGLYAKCRYDEALALFRQFAALYPDSFQVRQGHVEYFLRRISSAAGERTAGN